MTSEAPTGSAARPGWAERNPVSLRWFRIIWPFVWQKRLLMPLAQPKGIYCFYSRALIRELAAAVGQRSCLEIAADDGTLSRFLAAEGVDITATDDHSRSHSVTYEHTVVRKDAATALRRYQPQVVVCSWPPAKNKFEREVFRTRSVELYIVISSRHRVSAGNWDDYARQTGFEVRDDPRLSRLDLPSGTRCRGVSLRAARRPGVATHLTERPPRCPTVCRSAAPTTPSAADLRPSPTVATPGRHRRVDRRHRCRGHLRHRHGLEHHERQSGRS